MYTSCSPDVLSLEFSILMNNLSSNCGLVDAKVRASDIYLPVHFWHLVKLVFWSILSFKNGIFAKLISFFLSAYLVGDNLRELKENI